MMKAYIDGKQLVCHELKSKNLSLIKKAIWLDLISPTDQEEQIVEKMLGLNIPTQKEMSSIELSGRLYKQKDSLFMTAMMLANSTSPQPRHQPVTFIVTSNKLITIRYVEPQAFSLFVSNMANYDLAHNNANIMLLGLLEAIVDRFAENLAFVGGKLDDISQKIFNLVSLTKKHKSVNYTRVIKKIGLYADLNNKLRESIVTFNRLSSFFSQSIENIDDEKKLRVGTIIKDINALSDYTSFISNKVNFLLDATLGLINIDQSNIIKIFTVAAVIFLPPTLIASIYGMNFKFMPELSWEWGYAFVIVLMLLSAIFSYKFFKYKKWL